MKALLLRSFMGKAVFSFLQLLLALTLVISVASCSSSFTAGLNSYQSQDGRYAFLFPTGWTKVAVSGGPQVVFHDLINTDETLSLVVSKLESDFDLQKLGSPEAVGNRLIKEVVSSEELGREVELIEAQERSFTDHVFYDLEYIVHSPNLDRHELATVAVDRGFLYTFAAGTNEVRWPRIKNLFERVITSFTFLI